MARPPALLERPVARTRQTNDRLSATITLSLWRLRQTWWLLCMACLGFAAAMIIACTVPLLSAVASSSTLHSILQATPTRNQITLSITTLGLSSRVVQRLSEQDADNVQQAFGHYQVSAPQLVIRESTMSVISPASLASIYPLSIYATSLSELAPHLTLVRGQWAREGGTGPIEMMLTPEAAEELHLNLNDQITLQGLFNTDYQSTGANIDPSTRLTFKLVGLFEVPPSYVDQLEGESFLPKQTTLTLSYTLLTSTSSLLQSLDRMLSGDKQAVYSNAPFELNWIYRLHTEQVQQEQLHDLINHLILAQNLASNIQPSSLVTGSIYYQIAFPYIVDNELYNPVPGSYQLLDLLQKYDNQSSLIGIPITILAIQIIALLLFFVSILISMLVDRQVATNALLSSRGASSRQVFWSLSIQGVSICLLGALVGPLIAVLLVTWLTLHILPENGSAVVGETIGQPATLLTRLGPSGGATLLTALLVLILIIWQTSRLNVLTLRRETARTSRKPFWLRYYLDIVAALIALSGYGVSLYLASQVGSTGITSQALILAPLSLIAPLFLLLGCLLLFLRLFPWLLQRGANLASRNRGTAPMLALVQMARAPQQVVRMILLLSLTVAFAMFAQVFDASQAQRTIDIANYEAGADFNGMLPPALNGKPLATILHLYRSIPGVQSASADYSDDGTTNGEQNNPIAVKLRAIDPQTFGQTIDWIPTYSSQPLSRLLSEIQSTSRVSDADGNQIEVIPTIIDQAFAQQLGISVGGTFTLTLNNLFQSTLSYQIVAVVDHIPTVNSSLNTGITSTPGGMLVSQSALNTSYIDMQKVRNIAHHRKDPLLSVPFNHLWLRAVNQGTALTSIRHSLNAPQLMLSNLYDRQAIINDLQNDPLYLNVLLTLTIGTITAFMLALLGNLLASWINVLGRLSSFVVLRALGARSLQILATLLWEQGIIYLGALLLGLAFGLVLTVVTIPVLVFANLPTHGAMSMLSTTDFYLLQHTLPTQLVVPPSLPLTFVALIAVCALALYTMMRTALRPSITNELRLNED